MTPWSTIFVGCAVLSSATLAACDRKSSLTTAANDPKPITVFAAASTTDVMQESGRRYEAATRIKIVFNFGASSVLAKQIKEGAPADIFLSADQKWMDDLVGIGLIQAATREQLFRNELVLVSPADRTFHVSATPEFDFRPAFSSVKRIAVADPAHVPAGIYAKQSLQALGWWPELDKRILPAQDVRAALRLVEMGEADAGIVYSTDAKASTKVTILATFPASSHDSIEYPVALCKDAEPHAAAFLEFLRSPEMTAVFERAGFGIIPVRSTKH